MRIFTSKKFFKSKIAVVALITLFLGAFLRFNNIQGKIYWLDETFTSLQVSGHLIEEVRENVLTGEEIDIFTIRKYQYPDAETGYMDTVKGLISFEPQLTPFYFLTARFWLQQFGNSIFVVRSLSALAGILCLPIIYLLCIELFDRPSVSLMAVILVAVSPFHVLYSQEARPYSLWILTTLFSCLALLRVQKKHSVGGWLIYAFSLALSFYTFLFSLLTCFAHFVYILLSERFKLNKSTISFCLSALVATLSFIPWIVILVISPPSNYASFPPSSLLAYPKGWIRNISLLFADFGIDEKSSLVFLIAFLVYLLLLLFIVVYSFIFLKNNAPRKSYLFLFSLLVVPSVILLVHDFGTGGQTTLRASYQVSSLISIQLAVAYLLANKIASFSQNRKFWTGLTGILVVTSIWSCVFMTYSDTWWSKVDENIHHEVADVINQSDHPLLVSDDEFIRPFSLSHYLHEKTKFMLVAEPQYENLWHVPEIPDDRRDIFLYRPSELLKSRLVGEDKYELIPLVKQSEYYCDCSDEVLLKVESTAE